MSKPPSRHAPSTPPQESWAARKRFRNGELGSKHWLSRYGYEPWPSYSDTRQTQSRPYPNASSRYEHRRSEGDMDMHVDKTVELVWWACGRELSTEAIKCSRGDGDGGGDSGDGGSMCRCSICGFEFGSGAPFVRHVEELGVPSPVSSLREWRAAQSGIGPSRTT